MIWPDSYGTCVHAPICIAIPSKQEGCLQLFVYIPGFVAQIHIFLLVIFGGGVQKNDLKWPYEYLSIISST